MDVKNNIANNIVELRKMKKWTQVELAEKLNYTDKAISKWERAESTPDVECLYAMSKLFGVTVDFFFHDNSINELSKYIIPKKVIIRQYIQLSLLLTSIWFIAVVVFVYGHIKNASNAHQLWICFIYAIPVSCLISLIFFKRRNDVHLIPFIGSLLLWSLLAAIYLQGIVLNENYWLIFLIGIPIQVAIILGFWLKQ